MRATIHPRSHDMRRRVSRNRNQQLPLAQFSVAVTCLSLINSLSAQPAWPSHPRVAEAVTNILRVAEQGPFQPEWNSLTNYTVREWYLDAKFGIFIHWGVYSVPAFGNEHYSRRMYLTNDAAYRHHVATYGPQAKFGYRNFIPMFRAERFDAGRWARLLKQSGAKYVVPVAEHHDGFPMYDCSFTRWDAEKLVSLASKAGAKYLTFTTKWHDGFCLWDTAQTDWCVTKATSWKRDPMKELSRAAHRHGLKLMPYYSIIDWHHPGYEPRSKLNDLAAGSPDMDAYVRFMKAQLTELRDKYGPLARLWFDGHWEGSWTGERGRNLEVFCRELLPRGILNNRVAKIGTDPAGKHDLVGVNGGDFGTPELEIPANGLPGRDWGSCMTMNNTWGYRRDDTDWKTPAQVIRMLIDCASKGGNFMLNIGPRADGSIPEPSLEILEALADWMKVNSKSIYGTTASPFAETFPWGRVTVKGDTRKYDWNQLVQPLGEGSYDVAGFMRKLREIGYTGPVGFQTYQIKGEPQDILARSMAAWRKFGDAPVHPGSPQ